MTIVVGVDTKTQAMHWTSSRMIPGTYAYVGMARAPNGTHVEVARAYLYRQARKLFAGLPEGSYVFAEEPLALSKNPATTRLLCLAAGAIWSGFVQSNANATWVWTNPATWKKDVLGRGAPPKGDKHKPWIRDQLLLGEASKEFLPWLEHTKLTVDAFDDEADLYDAWCLMRHGIRVVDSL